MVKCCPGFLNTEEGTLHLLKQMGFKAVTLVSVDLFRCSMPGNDLIRQLFCNRLCFLVRKGKHLCPFREVVSNSQDVLLTRLSSRQRAHDVHCNSLECATWAATDNACSSWLLWGLPPGALGTLPAPVFNIMLLAIPIEVFSYLLQALVNP